MERNLQSGEAVKKLQQLIKSIHTCVFISSGKACDCLSRPMAVVDTDHQGNIWFFTNIHSNKVKDVEIENRVELVFAHPGKHCYLHVKGRAGVVTDKRSIQEKWTPVVKAWFPKGIDDPALCLLKVKTDEAFYWETGSSRIGEMIRMALSIMVRRSLLKGVHGELHV